MAAGSVLEEALGDLALSVDDKFAKFHSMRLPSGPAQAA